MRRALTLLSSVQRAVKSSGARRVHTSCVRRKLYDIAGKDAEKERKVLVKKQSMYFDEEVMKQRNKEAFRYAIARYLQKEGVYRRGHVEFIYAALERLKKFKVHRDIETYRMLLAVFPKHKMVPKNTWQVEFMHYPKQQHCCIDILEEMESHGVIPDDAMGYQLVTIFGNRTHAFRKYQRMMYWMPKFRNMNPYPVPFNLPKDETELAILALKRMAVDLRNEISVDDAAELVDAYDHTFIVSAQSSEQRELLDSCPVDRPLYVQGGFPVWLRSRCLTYFILKAEAGDTSYDPNKYWEEVDKDENLFKWSIPFTESASDSQYGLVVPPSVHQQDDGTVLGMCITGTGSKDSLRSWVRILQRDIPKLAEIPVVFTLRTPEGGIQKVPEDSDSSSHPSGHTPGYS